MTPERPDRDVVGRRLRAIADTLDDLAPLRGVTPERLRAEPLTRAAVERLVQVIVDLAIDLNAHLAAALLGRAPATGRDSLAMAAEAGVIDAGLAERLAPAAGLRNLLVHRYQEVRLELVAGSVDPVLDGFADYQRSVAAYLDRGNA